jgi:predicted SpoU family rRNA methylase
MDSLWDEMTDYQAAVCTLIMYGYTQADVARHFEVSKQSIREILDVVGAKLIRIQWMYDNEKQAYL